MNINEFITDLKETLKINKNTQLQFPSHQQACKIYKIKLLHSLCSAQRITNKWLTPCRPLKCFLSYDTCYMCGYNCCACYSNIYYTYEL